MLADAGDVFAVCVYLFCKRAKVACVFCKEQRGYAAPKMNSQMIAGH